MLCNIMFYGVEGDPTTQKLMENAPIDVNVNEVIIAIESALVALPVNVLIMELFKLSKWRRKKENHLDEIRRAYEESRNAAANDSSGIQGILEDVISKTECEADENVESVSGECIHKEWKEAYWKRGVGLKLRKTKDKSKNPPTNASGVGSAGNGNVDSDVPEKGQDDSDQIPKDDTEDQDQACVAVDEQLEATENPTPATPKGVRYSLVHLGNPLRRLSSLYAPKRVGSATQDSELVISLAPNLSIPKTNITTKKRICAQYPFPGILMYIIAWILVSAVIFVSLFFTILYSFDYGLLVSTQWVRSLFMSTFMDIFLNEPGEVLFLAAVLSLVWKKPSEDEDLLVVKTWRPTEQPGSELEISRSHLQWKLDHQNPAYLPPSEEVRFVGTEEKKEQRRLYSLLREIGGYILYMYLVILITYGRRDSNIFRTNELFAKTFEDGGFSEITETGSLWEWMNTTVADTLYPEEASPGHIADGAGVLVGSPLLRQIRVKQENCVSQAILKALPDVLCTHDLRGHTKDTRPYGQQWVPYANFSTEQDYNEEEKAWFYDQSLGYSARGELSGYPVGGYAIPLGANRSSFDAVFDHLYQNSWVDRQTAAVILEVTTYNANTNLLTLTLALVELPSYGGAFTKLHTRSMKLFRSTSSLQIFLIVFEIAFCGFTFGFLISVLIRVYQLGKKFFRSLWSWVDMMIVVYSLVAIAIYAEHTVEVDRLLKDYKTSAVDFSYAMDLDEAMVFCLGLLVAVGTVKLLHLLRFSQYIHVFSLIILRSVPAVIGVFIGLCVLKIGFACLVTLLIGNLIEDFKSFASTLGTIAFDTDNETALYSEIHDFWGPFVFMFYIIIRTYLLTNLLLTVLCDTLTEVSHVPQPNEDADFVRHLWERFRHWMMVSGKGQEDKKPKRTSRTFRLGKIRAF